MTLPVSPGQQPPMESVLLRGDTAAAAGTASTDSTSASAGIASAALHGVEALRPTLRLLVAAGYDLTALQAAARARDADQAAARQLRPAAGAE